MDLVKEYLDKKIHYRMLRNIALNIELELNKMNTYIFESDIQKYMDDFLRLELKHTGYYPQRETCSKTDLVIFKKIKKDDTKASDQNELKPLIGFEIKSAFKKNESFNNKLFKENIIKDFFKLKKTKMKVEKVFFLLAFKKNKMLENKNSDEVSDMINEMLSGKKNKVTYLLNQNNETIKVKSSYKCIIDRTIILTWEIL